MVRIYLSPSWSNALTHSHSHQRSEVHHLPGGQRSLAVSAQTKVSGSLGQFSSCNKHPL